MKTPELNYIEIHRQIASRSCQGSTRRAWKQCQRRRSSLLFWRRKTVPLSSFGGLRSILWHPHPSRQQGTRRIHAHRSPLRTPQVHPSPSLEQLVSWHSTCHFGAPYGCSFLFPGATTPEKGDVAPSWLTLHLGQNQNICLCISSKHINLLSYPKALHSMRILDPFGQREPELELMFSHMKKSQCFG